MQTNRDAQIVNWLGRVGAADVHHVMDQFGIARYMAYRRLALLVAHGLVERRRLLYERPGMYTATSTGLRWQGLDRFGAFRLSPSGCEHAWQATTVAVALCKRLPSWRILAEREIRAREIEERRLFASADMGSIHSSRMRHRPDLAAIASSGAVVSIEVELTVKAPRALTMICRGWARARHVDHVYYLATPEAARAVNRALDRVKAHDRVTVLDLDDVAGLAAHALAREQAALAREAPNAGVGAPFEAPEAGVSLDPTPADHDGPQTSSNGKDSSNVFPF